MNGKWIYKSAVSNPNMHIGGFFCVFFFSFLSLEYMINFSSTPDTEQNGWKDEFWPSARPRY